MREMFSGVAFEGFFSWLAAHDLIEQIPERHAKGQRRAGFDHLVRRCSPQLATWVLLRTRAGNWIFAAGGDANAARNSGVPVDRVKTGLFMLTACAAALVADADGARCRLDRCAARLPEGVRGDHRRRDRRLPADRRLRLGHRRVLRRHHLRHGVDRTDLYPFDSDWFQVFLGAMLLLAVLFNNFIRKRK